MTLRIFVLSFLCACLALGAGIDGKWTSEIKTAGKKGGKRADQTQRVTFDLKSDGDRLGGTVNIGGRKRSQSAEIQNGKIEGNRFSFVTVRRSKKGGERKQEWKGTIDGDTLHGTRGLEGARRKAQFTAKREG